MAAATAAVFVAGQRAGSAVLVDKGRLLTAGHVLRRAETSAGAPSARVEVMFPFAPASEAAGRVPAQRMVPDEPAAVDLAVLALAPETAGWLPAEAPLSPLRRLPRRVSVFGFPRQERELRGVWREFDTAGPAADGTVQLDWAGDAGTLPGHSGGPVIDPASGALVGVLVQGSQEGRFDRFVPMTMIRSYCPDLPFPWFMAGADARSHFTRRSHGQRSHSRGRDLFRGRQTALALIHDWLTAPRDQGRPLVVTGQPGAGKSAVLARAALDLETARTGPGLAFHARGAIHDDLLTAVADLIGTEHADTRDALLEALDDEPDDELVIIAVDALDEAASSPDRKQLAETLVELAAVPRVRVAVATRPLAAGNRYQFGGLLPALGIASADSPALVDLDTDRYFEPDGLRQFAAAVLTQHQARHPNPADAAWAAYRADRALCDRLAAMIADRAHRNYLVAAMAAVPLSVADQPVDPETADFDPSRIPSGVGEALGKYLEQLPDPQQSRTRALLTALAYARGDGIDDRTWIAFASALGYPADTADLDQLRASTAADYLLQTILDDIQPLTRLFHQALADELLTRRHQPSDERALLTTLRPVPGTTWATASGYALTHAADHASSARQLLSLLDDPTYLTHADLGRLPSLISLDAETAADPIAAIVRRAAGRANRLTPSRRARLLALTAAHFGLADLRRRLAAACDQPFTPVWAHSLGIPHMELTGHADIVAAVAVGRTGDRDVIVSAGQDQTVRVWDAATGEPRGRPLTGHTGMVAAVAVGRTGDRDVIVSASHDGTVRVWDAATGEPRGEPLTGHTGMVAAAAYSRDGRVEAVAVGRAGDRDIIVSGDSGLYSGMVRVWDAVTGEPRGESLAGHHGWVEAVAVGRAGDRDIIVSGTANGTMQVWDAVTGEPRGESLAGHRYRVAAVAVGRAGDRDVIVSGQNGTVRMWDAVTGEFHSALYLSSRGARVEALAVGRAGDRDIIVSGEDQTVRVWDAVTGEPCGHPLTGHYHWVEAVAVGHAGDRDVIVSGDLDGTVRVWDAVTGEPLTGHTGPVAAVAVGRAGDRDVIVSAGQDTTVRVWDAVTGEPRGEPLTGHTGPVAAVAVGRAGDRDVIVSGGQDQTVRVWDFAERKSLVIDLLAPAAAVAYAKDARTLCVGSGHAICLFKE